MLAIEVTYPYPPITYDGDRPSNDLLEGIQPAHAIQFERVLYYGYYGNGYGGMLNGGVRMYGAKAFVVKAMVEGREQNLLAFSSMEGKVHTTTLESGNIIEFDIDYYSLEGINATACTKDRIVYMDRLVDNREINPGKRRVFSYIGIPNGPDPRLQQKLDTFWDTSA